MYPGHSITFALQNLWSMRRQLLSGRHLHFLWFSILVAI